MRRTLMIGQVWEHWRSRNRVQILDIDDMVNTVGDDGHAYKLDAEDLMSSYLYIGELEPE